MTLNSAQSPRATKRNLRCLSEPGRRAAREDAMLQLQGELSHNESELAKSTHEAKLLSLEVAGGLPPRASQKKLRRCAEPGAAEPGSDRALALSGKELPCAADQRVLLSHSRSTLSKTSSAWQTYKTSPCSARSMTSTPLWIGYALKRDARRL